MQYKSILTWDRIDDILKELFNDEDTEYNYDYDGYPISVDNIIYHNKPLKNVNIEINYIPLIVSDIRFFPRATGDDTILKISTVNGSSPFSTIYLSANQIIDISTNNY